MTEPGRHDQPLQPLASTEPAQRTLPPRARFETNAPRVVLSGDWLFRLWPSLADVPENAHEPGFDDSSWETIPVPSNWPMHGHGALIYTNTRFPFPVDPPWVPDANPIGDHRIRFSVDQDFPMTATLRFDGVDSAGEVWLNGALLGSTRGSRLMHEFDASGALLPGENLLHVRVARWSAASYLEDQDMWWLPGVFREVTLVGRPAGGIRDVFVHADYEPDSGDGLLRVDVKTDSGAIARVDVPDLGLHDIEVGQEVRIRDIRPWSAEAPALYDVLISTASEQCWLRSGFRRIRVESGRFLVNGSPVLFRGVNRHEHDPDTGRVVPRSVVEAELRLMKRHNINAIRTSHYPPHPDVLALADELGFYLIDECDLETHGFVHFGWRGNPSDDPVWADAFTDRMARTVHRDKNHPSVLMWSLGNEAGTGCNLRAMAEVARSIDPERPIHYEGDAACEYVDVYSRMYVSHADLERTGRHEEPPLEDFEADGHRRSLPVILCEYAHAMGNGPGGLREYQDIFERYDRLHGGFVWEWVEHGIRRFAADGAMYFAYGGEFGEVVHDGNFVIDGLVDADRKPRPGLSDVGKTIEPIKMEVIDSRSAVRIRNLYDFVTTEHLEFRWTHTCGVGGHAGGRLDVPPIPPGGSADVALPTGARSGASDILTISARLAADTDWAHAGHEVAWAQSGALQVPVAPNATADPVEEDDHTIRLGPATFDALTGDMLSIGEVHLHGPRLTLWRAPTDNDRGIGLDTEADVSDAEVWSSAGLDRLQRRVLSVVRGDRRLFVRARYAPAGSELHVDLTCEFWSDGDAMGLAVHVQPGERWTGTWARIGLEFDSAEIGDVTWEGSGPGEKYPDTGQSQRLGTYRLPLDALQPGYVRPQEGGSRGDCVRVSFGTSRGTIEVAGGPFAFTASRWTTREIATAERIIDLPQSCGTTFIIDLAQHGIGSASCGPGVLPSYRLFPHATKATLAIR